MKKQFIIKIMIVFSTSLFGTNSLYAQPYFSRYLHNGGSSFPNTTADLIPVSGIQIQGTTQGIVNVGNVDGVVAFHSLTPSGNFVTNSSLKPCNVGLPNSSSTFLTNGFYGFQNHFISANDVVEIDPTNGILAITGYMRDYSSPNDIDAFITLIDVYGRIYSTIRIGANTHEEVANAICKKSDNSAIYLTGYTKNLTTLNVNILAMKYTYAYTGGVPSITFAWSNEYELGGASASNYQNEVGKDICMNNGININDAAIYIVGKVDRQYTSIVNQTSFGIEIDDNGNPRNAAPYFNFIYDYEYYKSELKKVIYDDYYDRIFYSGDFYGGDEALSCMLFGDYDPTNGTAVVNHRDVRYFNYLNLPCTLKSMLMSKANNSIYLFVHGPYHNTSAYYDDGFLLPIDPTNFDTYSEIRFLPRTNDITNEWIPTDISEDVSLDYITMHSCHYYSGFSRTTVIENIYHNGYLGVHCNDFHGHEYGAPYEKEVLTCEHITFSQASHSQSQYTLCEDVSELWSTQYYCDPPQFNPSGGHTPVLIPLFVKKNAFDLFEKEKSTASETSSIEVNKSTNNVLNLYPNPFTGIITIQLAAIGESQISIANIQGKTLYNKTFEANTNIITLNDLQYLQPGMYFVSVTQNGNTTIHKVVKQ